MLIELGGLRIPVPTGWAVVAIRGEEAFSWVRLGFQPGIERSPTRILVEKSALELDLTLRARASYESVKQLAEHAIRKEIPSGRYKRRVQEVKGREAFVYDWLPEGRTVQICFWEPEIATGGTWVLRIDRVQTGYDSPHQEEAEAMMRLILPMSN